MPRNVLSGEAGRGQEDTKAKAKAGNQLQENTSQNVQCFPTISIE
jgi:hypothetical protein